MWAPIIKHMNFFYKIKTIKPHKDRYEMETAMRAGVISFALSGHFPFNFDEEHKVDLIYRLPFKCHGGYATLPSDHW